MKVKRFTSVFLLAFVFLSIVFLVYKEFARKDNKTANSVVEIKTHNTSTPLGPVPAKDSVAKEISSTQHKAVMSVQQVPQTTKSKVIAYYFHGTYRCSTCQTIERYSREAIENYFSKELRDGRLEFKPLNTDEPENQHFIQDYQLFTKSLVITLYRDDKQLKWKNLTEVWVHVGDKENFYKYVKNEIESLLNEIE